LGTPKANEEYRVFILAVVIYLTGDPIMFNKVSHIGIAVKDLQASIDLFSRLLGKQPDQIEDVPDQKVKTALFAVGSSNIELTQGTDLASPVIRFLEKRGEGVHHVSFVVDDIEQELARLKGAGFRLIDERPRIGADGFLVAFLHPQSTNGVLIEISQKTS
jgi:methylmalonyl-CoA/ethylmalonyl-CoA epimerase